MTVPDRFRGRKSVSLYGLTFSLPMVLWQLVFFVFPLLFLVALTFWLVKNYRMVPGFETVNWVKMYTRGYFWDAFGFTFAMALASTAVTSVLAFPCAYALAFNVSRTVRRWAVFFLIIPFFTSYLVRAYTWQIFLGDEGIINGFLSLFGLGPLPLLNSPVGTLVGYLTLTLPLVVVLQLFSLSAVDRSLVEAAWNLGASEWRAMAVVILPFTRPAIVSALCLTAAVSFDEFAVAWFVSGLNKTVPVIILEILQGNVDPQINAIGSFVFIMSMTLVVIAQVLLMTRESRNV